jgi:hypothetical protein
MKCRRTLRNFAGNRRMIDTAYDLATWQNESLVAFQSYLNWNG